MFEDDGRLTANVTRVELFGSADNNWGEMIIDPSSKYVFSFKPVVLKQHRKFYGAYKAQRRRPVTD